MLPGLAGLASELFKEAGFNLEKYAQLRHFFFHMTVGVNGFQRLFRMAPGDRYFLLYATICATSEGNRTDARADANAMQWKILHNKQPTSIMDDSGLNENLQTLNVLDADAKYFTAIHPTTDTFDVTAISARVPILRTVEGGRLEVTIAPENVFFNTWEIRGSVVAMKLKGGR